MIAQDFGEGHIADRGGVIAGEYPFTSCREFRALLEYPKCLIAQRNTVQLLCLHPISGDCPRLACYVDFAPTCQPNLSRTRSRQYEEEESLPPETHPFGRGNQLHNARQVLSRHRGEMFHAIPFRFQSRQQGIHR